jgi:uncharacterized protein YdhG (YjbR/CyaY superfamily)
LSEILTYIDQFEGKTKTQLLEMYRGLQQILPNAVECISYKMPCFKEQNEAIIYFAGYKNHLGFYPTSKPIEALKHRLAKYKHSKGAVQFPLDEPLPWAIIRELIEYRLTFTLG